MNFIIDAQLPESLVKVFADHDVIHTKSLEQGNYTKDREINKLSMKENRVVITKDTDFYYSYLSAKIPYKLVLVKLGNIKLKELIAYFEQNKTQLLEILETHSLIILEKSKIRMLE